MRYLAVLFCVVTVAVSHPISQDESVLRAAVGNFMNCVNSEELNICLKEHALKAAERLGTVRKLRLTDSIRIINNGEERESKSLEPLSSDPEVKSRQLTERLWESADGFFKNSELEFSYTDEDEDDSSSRALEDVEEGRGKKKEAKKKLKALIPLAILAKAKAIALALLALWLIAISIWKIATIVKIAFIVKLLALLKLLLSKKHHHQEEVWISPPEHHEEHHVSHGWEPHHGWARTRPDASNLAYSAYRK